MIPLRDDNPSRINPLVTISLIVVCAIVFLWQLSLGGRGDQQVTYSLGLIPSVLFGIHHLSPDLVMVPPAATIFTSMFLHGGWMHIIGNMWYLWIFGDNVEDRLGHGRFIIFYLLAGAVAALGQIAVDPTSTLPTIGASGAIAGVMGGYFVLYPRSRVLTAVTLIIFWEIIEVPAIVLLGFWFLMQLFSAGSIAVTASTGGGGVAFAAHVVGFVFGMGAVFLFRKRATRPWEN